ncbi:MAG: cytochrome c3 family protein [Flavobacteriaceae bacterium]|jgi:mono/diheme cytochrome c family protein|nr:cytochrome c3 family protein [Flavobacteriaceae bacterium]
MDLRYKRQFLGSFNFRNNLTSSNSFLIHLFFTFFLIFPFTNSFSQDVDITVGKSLFNTNCAACHKLDKKMTGPALRHVENRLLNDEGLDKQWLYAWIRNSSAVIKSGDSYANKIYAEYNRSAMTAYPQLSDADIENILAYTDQEKIIPVASVSVSSVAAPSNNLGLSNEVILGIFSLLFFLLAIALLLVSNTLRSFAILNDVKLIEKEKSKPIWKAFIDNQFLMLCSAILFLLVSAYGFYGWTMQIGTNQGYMPVQPIHYSHKIHAGDNQIDCNYCHSSARVSKHSGIPSLNVCMNCHKTIFEYNGETTEEYSKTFYDGEIQKLYKAVGWDDEAQEYTGETSPVKWVRIHNLPDFAYFNHSQHVSVAGIECQTCHGPVEEMEIMYQSSPLTMGWCINCHRETNVKVKDNEYYSKIHKELSKKYGVEQLTVAQMGGMECGKCHY